LSFDAKLNSLGKLRNLVISLWNAFLTLANQTFLHKAQNITVLKEDNAYYKDTYINPNNYKIWMNASSDDISRKRYMRFLKDIHQDMTTQEARKLINAFGQKSETSDISPLLDKLNKDTKGAMRKYIEKGLGNVTLEDGVLVIRKELISIDAIDIGKIERTKIKFRFEGLKKVEYYVREESLYGLKERLKWLESISNDGWTVIMCLARGEFFVPFASKLDKAIDLTSVTDKTVKLSKTHHAGYISNKNLPYELKFRSVLDFHVEDSFTVHTVSLKVYKSY
jgi:hypothetical protein